MVVYKCMFMVNSMWLKWIKCKIKFRKQGINAAQCVWIAMVLSGLIVLYSRTRTMCQIVKTFNSLFVSCKSELFVRIQVFLCIAYVKLKPKNMNVTCVGSFCALEPLRTRNIQMKNYYKECAFAMVISNWKLQTTNWGSVLEFGNFSMMMSRFWYFLFLFSYYNLNMSDSLASYVSLPTINFIWFN